MSSQATVPVMESIEQKNEQLARQINEKLTKRRVFAVNVMGAPGAGKTSSLVQIIERLPCPSAVIEGDIESSIDTEKLRALGVAAVQINTGGACHLDTPLIEDALSSIDLADGMLFIENIGNLVCPAEFLIGEHIKMLICTVTEGSDKPYKYPLAFEKADIILLNKSDLAPHVDFDEAYFTAGVRALNPSVPIFGVSAKTGGGFDGVAQCLTDLMNTAFDKIPETL